MSYCKHLWVILMEDDQKIKKECIKCGLKKIVYKVSGIELIISKTGKRQKTTQNS